MITVPYIVSVRDHVTNNILFDVVEFDFSRVLGSTPITTQVDRGVRDILDKYLHLLPDRRVGLIFIKSIMDVAQIGTLNTVRDKHFRLLNSNPGQYAVFYNENYFEQIQDEDTLPGTMSTSGDYRVVKLKSKDEQILEVTQGSAVGARTSIALSETQHLCEQLMRVTMLDKTVPGNDLPLRFTKAAREVMSALGIETSALSSLDLVAEGEEEDNIEEKNENLKVNRTTEINNAEDSSVTEQNSILLAPNPSVGETKEEISVGGANQRKFTPPPPPRPAPENSNVSAATQIPEAKANVNGLTTFGTKNLFLGCTYTVSEYVRFVNIRLRKVFSLSEDVHPFNIVCKGEEIQFVFNNVKAGQIIAQAVIRQREQNPDFCTVQEEGSEIKITSANQNYIKHLHELLVTYLYDQIILPLVRYARDYKSREGAIVALKNRLIPLLPLRVDNGMAEVSDVIETIRGWWGEHYPHSPLTEDEARESWCGNCGVGEQVELMERKLLQGVLKAVETINQNVVVDDDNLKREEEAKARCMIS